MSTSLHKDAPPDLVTAGEVEINGRRYCTPKRLGRLLSRSAATIRRWHRAGIGPHRIRVGALILYPMDGVARWLAGHQSGPRGRADGPGHDPQQLELDFGGDKANAR